MAALTAEQCAPESNVHKPSPTVTCATGVALNDMWTGPPQRVKTIAVLRAVDLALPGLPG
jgi:hypothetical protein